MIERARSMWRLCGSVIGSVCAVRFGKVVKLACVDLDSEEPLLKPIEAGGLLGSTQLGPDKLNNRG